MSGMTPPPRPALRKASDGSVHPAAPRRSSLFAQLPPRPAERDEEAGPTGPDPGAAGRGKKGGAGKGAGGPGKGGAGGPGKRKRGADLPLPPPPTGPDDKLVEVVVEMPKGMRRRLREKAEEHGYTTEEAAFNLLRVWLDG